MLVQNQSSTRQSSLLSCWNLLLSPRNAHSQAIPIFTIFPAHFTIFLGNPHFPCPTHSPQVAIWISTHILANHKYPKPVTLEENKPLLAYKNSKEFYYAMKEGQHAVMLQSFQPNILHAKRDLDIRASDMPYLSNLPDQACQTPCIPRLASRQPPLGLSIQHKMFATEPSSSSKEPTATSGD